MPAATRPPPWKAAVDVVSALNRPWQPSHPDCETISRASGAPAPLGT
jgi:hypothetical protein